MKWRNANFKTMANTLPSIASLMNFQSPHSNKLLTVSGWDDLSIISDEYVDQRPNIASPPTHTVRTIAQSFSSAEDDEANQDCHCDFSHHFDTDSEDDNFVFDIIIQADKPQLCQAKQAHELVLGKTDSALVQKLLTVSDASHLHTKALIQKLDEVAKEVDLNDSTNLAEQMKHPRLGTVRSWVHTNTSPDIR